MTTHNLAKYEAPTTESLREQIADIEKSIRLHRARGIWVLANDLERDKAAMLRALRRLESIEPKSGVHRRPE